LTEAGMRRRDQAALDGERSDKRLPLVESAGPMQKEKRRSLSGFEKLKFDICYFDGLQAGTSQVVAACFRYAAHTIVV